MGMNPKKVEQALTKREINHLEGMTERRWKEAMKDAATEKMHQDKYLAEEEGIDQDLGRDTTDLDEADRDLILEIEEIELIEEPKIARFQKKDSSASIESSLHLHPGRLHLAPQGSHQAQVVNVPHPQLALKRARTLNLR